MSKSANIEPSRALKDVRYEVRGHLARRAQELERQGYEILSLNIGDPGLFGFRTPETMRLAMIENLNASEAYCPVQQRARSVGSPDRARGLPEHPQAVLQRRAPLRFAASRHQGGERQ